ncbi:MAG: tRNA preQ1(34) S-adenosylmethionine ribosyltransferase-isomerase QueA [Planctomycetota bacterium]
MRTADFDFDLPPERIAQEPVTPRDAARLLVRSAGGDVAHARVRDHHEYLEVGDLVVVNDTRVIPARVRALRTTGGRVELLLLEPRGQDPQTWCAMARPAKKLREGEVLACDAGVEALLVRRDPEDGTWLVRLRASADRNDLASALVLELLDAAGSIPLPPYIEREATDEDAERYQTIYARAPGAIAAPTAGLHLTERMFDDLQRVSIDVARVTLHVGAGTFLPVTADRVEDHRMHSERYEVSGATADAVRACRARGGRVVPVGTTSARVLEACAELDPAFERAVVRAGSGSTDIFLSPGHGPRVCDGLFTNFHLPKSTLVMLVAAFIGTEEVLSLYRTAVEERYRFYSYGDAMLLAP